MRVKMKDRTRVVHLTAYSEAEEYVACMRFDIQTMAEIDELRSRADLGQGEREELLDDRFRLWKAMNRMTSEMFGHDRMLF